MSGAASGQVVSVGEHPAAPQGTIGAVWAAGHGVGGGQLSAGLTAGLATTLWGMAMVAVLIADRPPPLRRVRINIYPALVTGGSITSLALVLALVTRARHGRRGRGSVLDGGTGLEQIGAVSHLRTLTARAITRAVVETATALWAAIRVLAHRDRGIVSVGEKARTLVKLT